MRARAISAVITGYLGESDTFDKAIADFSAVYADQTERNHGALKKAVRMCLSSLRWRRLRRSLTKKCSAFVSSRVNPRRSKSAFNGSSAPPRNRTDRQDFEISAPANLRPTRRSGGELGGGRLSVTAPAERKAHIDCLDDARRNPPRSLSKNQHCLDCCDAPSTSELGHSLRIFDVRAASACPPIADVSRRRGELSLRAKRRHRCG